MLRSCMRNVYHRKAALIQACVRAMQGSMKLKEKKAAAIVIHAAARRFVLRNRYRSVLSKVCWGAGGGAEGQFLACVRQRIGFQWGEGGFVFLTELGRGWEWFGESGGVSCGWEL